jgi:hypothetical protein
MRFGTKDSPQKAKQVTRLPARTRWLTWRLKQNRRPDEVGTPVLITRWPTNYFFATFTPLNRPIFGSGPTIGAA